MTYPTQLYGWLGMCTPIKLKFSFLQEKTAFWCSFKRVPNWRFVCPIYSLSQSLQGIEEIVSVHCSVVTESLGLYAQSLRSFLNNLNVVAIQNSLNGFRTTLNVRNNSTTSHWLPLIRSAVSCNWCLAVTEKSFYIAIRLGHREDISSPQPSNRVKMVDSQPSWVKFWLQTFYGKYIAENRKWVICRCG